MGGSLAGKDLLIGEGTKYPPPLLATYVSHVFNKKYDTDCICTPIYIYHIIYYINDGNIYMYISYIIYYSYDVRMYWGINYMMCQYDMLRKTSMICRYASILLADHI